MMKIQKIYSWLLLLTVALAMVGCSNDEEAPLEPGTYLVVNTRAVNVDNSVPDEHVECLRVIGFNKEGKQVCNELHEKNDIKIIGSGDAARAQVTLKLKEKGAITLYFFANETGEYFVTKQDGNPVKLTEVLKTPTLEESVLQQLRLSYSKSLHPKTTEPLLMTGKETILVSADHTEMGEIGLKRAFAKLTLNFNMAKPVVEGSENPRIFGTLNQLGIVSDNVPSRYYLVEDLDKPTKDNNKESLDFLDGKYNYIENKELSDANSTFSFYVPECILSSEDNLNANGWKLFVQVTQPNGRVVNGEITLDNQNGDYNIYRNTEYKVNASILDRDPMILDLSVEAWIEANEAGISWTRTFDFDFTPADVQIMTDGNSRFYPVMYEGTGTHRGTLKFKFNLRTAVNWSASLSDGEHFEFEDGTSVGTGGSNVGEKVIIIHAKNTVDDYASANNGEYPQCFLVIRALDAEGRWTKLMIDEYDATSATSPSHVLIKVIK